MHRCKMNLLSGISVSILLLVTSLAAEQTRPANEQDSAKPSENRLSKKERKRRQKETLKTLSKPFKQWLTEEIVYIIHSEERSDFLLLETDAGREEFIGQFWLRRDPTPDTYSNEFKQEHYRRIAYADKRFGTAIPGWRSDRGRVYITYGPPNGVLRYDGHSYGPPQGEQFILDSLFGNPAIPAPTYPTFPFHKWHYNYVAGAGNNIDLEFVDFSGTGEYKLSSDVFEKYPLITYPGGAANFAFSILRLDRGSPFIARLRERMIQQPIIVAILTAPPPVPERKTTEEIITRIRFNLLPFSYRVDFFRAAKGNSLVPVTLSFNPANFLFDEPADRLALKFHLKGFVTDPLGHTMQSFEKEIRWELTPERVRSQTPLVYQRPLELPPGRYQLHLELTDKASGDRGDLDEELVVPSFNHGQLTHSSLILADWMTRIDPEKDSGQPFVLGDVQVRPNLTKIFQQDQTLGIFLRVYNVGLDPQTGRPDATIRYTILAEDGITLDLWETTSELGITADEFSIEKLIPLAISLPGAYSLRIQITDHVRNQTIEPQTDFTVVKR